jgi:gas vesicle protein
MKNKDGERTRNPRLTKNGLVITLLIGSLIGAAAALLFAPQSGKQMRALLYQRSTQLRDRKQMDRLTSALEAGNFTVEVV